MAKCKKCGAFVSKDDIFCPECKRKFPILNWSFSYPRGNCPFTYSGEWKNTSVTKCDTECTCHKCSDKND